MIEKWFSSQKDFIILLKNLANQDIPAIRDLDPIEIPINLLEKTKDSTLLNHILSIYPDLEKISYPHIFSIIYEVWRDMLITLIEQRNIKAILDHLVIFFYYFYPPYYFWCESIPDIKVTNESTGKLIDSNDQLIVFLDQKPLNLQGYSIQITKIVNIKREHKEKNDFTWISRGKKEGMKRFFKKLQSELGVKRKFFETKRSNIKKASTMKTSPPKLNIPEPELRSEPDYVDEKFHYPEEIFESIMENFNEEEKQANQKKPLNTPNYMTDFTIENIIKENKPISPIEEINKLIYQLLKEHTTSPSDLLELRNIYYSVCEKVIEFNGALNYKTLIRTIETDQSKLKPLIDFGLIEINNINQIIIPHKISLYYIFTKEKSENIFYNLPFNDKSLDGRLINRLYWILWIYAEKNQLDRANKILLDFLDPIPGAFSLFWFQLAKLLPLLPTNISTTPIAQFITKVINLLIGQGIVSNSSSWEAYYSKIKQPVQNPQHVEIINHFKDGLDQFLSLNLSDPWDILDSKQLKIKKAGYSWDKQHAFSYLLKFPPSKSYSTILEIKNIEISLSEKTLIEEIKKLSWIEDYHIPALEYFIKWETPHIKQYLEKHHKYLEKHQKYEALQSATKDANYMKGWF